VVTGLLVVAAGIVALRVPQPSEGEGGGPRQAQTVALVAKNIQFDTASLNVVAGRPITLKFTNDDAGVQHDVAVFRGKDATAPVVFRGGLETGVASVDYHVPPLQPPGGGGGGPGQGGAIALSAKNVAYSDTTLTASGGGEVTIDFSNEDTQPHNVAVFDGKDATAPVLFRGDIVAPGDKATFQFQAPPPGSYYFHCDVHPQMTGTLTVSG
jgi:plastocyanin